MKKLITLISILALQLVANAQGVYFIQEPIVTTLAGTTVFPVQEDTGDVHTGVKKATLDQIITYVNAHVAVPAAFSTITGNPADNANLSTALGLLALKTTTVNGQPLSGNVSITPTT